MFKRSFFTMLLLFSLGALCAQTEDAWVYFKNKPSKASYLADPLTMLSQRSLDRRIRYSIPLDAKDVPVEQTYITQVKNSVGITVMAQSKWLNALHIKGAEADIKNLETLDFIANIHFANTSLNSPEKSNKIITAEIHEKGVQYKTALEYGKTANQIKLINADELHEQGFTGKGMQIAIMDAGFPGVDTYDAFDRIRTNNQIKGGYNFVDRTTNYYSSNSHGTAVLSTIAGYIENKFVGTAPDAEFYLFITEDNNKETPLEESLWVEAAEKADSLGVDVLNTSLGYFTFDNPNYNYSYNDLDGKTTFISRGAEIAFTRGMLVVNSAGNEGNNSWRYIIAPADANAVLSIGAVDNSGSIASFSSFGPTPDGRVKPDVCAQGAGVYVINNKGEIATSNGTSFSAPILSGAITCLWQAFPNKTNSEIVQLVKEYSSLFYTSTDQEGYGIPNFKELYHYLKGMEPEIKEFTVYPNPVEDSMLFKFPTAINELELQIFNSIGQLIVSKIIYKESPETDLYFLNNGLYLLHISYSNGSTTIKIIKN